MWCVYVCVEGACSCVCEGVYVCVVVVCLVCVVVLLCGVVVVICGWCVVVLQCGWCVVVVLCGWCVVVCCGVAVWVMCCGGVVWVMCCGVVCCVVWCVTLKNHVCAFKTLACVRSKRPRVYRQHAHIAHWEVVQIVPISWMCKKQALVSPSSAESANISLDPQGINLVRDSQTCIEVSIECTPIHTAARREIFKHWEWWTIRNTQGLSSLLHGQSAENVQLQVLYHRWWIWISCLAGKNHRIARVWVDEVMLKLRETGALGSIIHKRRETGAKGCISFECWEKCVQNAKLVKIRPQWKDATFAESLTEGKLKLPFKEWTKLEEYYQMLKLTLIAEIGNKENPNSLCMSVNSSLNLSRVNYFRQVNGLIKLKEKGLSRVENKNWRIEFITTLK